MVTDVGPTARKHRLGWFQYSLRSLIVSITLFGILCSWLGVRIREARREREAAIAIENLGGAVGWSEPGGTAWLRHLIGENPFEFAEIVTLDDTQAGDAELDHVKKLNRLKCLSICRTRITDTGVDKLIGLNELQWLHLDGTSITDDGEKKLREALPFCLVSKNLHVAPSRTATN